MLVTPESRTTLPERNLDILRAVAVLGVLADHVAEIVGVGSAFTRWLGGAGVQSFFVHTCLVLMASMERDGAPARAGWVRRFYVRRAFRIYPLAWVVIAIVLLFHVPPAGPRTLFQPGSLTTLLSNLALAQNLVGERNLLIVMWTLPVELQMYVVLPLCFLIARRNSRAWMLGLLAVGMLAAMSYAWGINDGHRIPGMWRLTVLRFVPSFLMGVLAYWLLHRRKGTERTLPAWTWLPIILTAITVFYFPRHAWGARWFVLAAYCAVLGLAIPRVREASDSAYSRLAHVIATYSYGIYLLHLLATRVGFWRFRDWPLAAQCVVAAVALVIGCLVAYHAIERPGINLGQRLLGATQRRPPLESTAPAP